MKKSRLIISIPILIISYILIASIFFPETMTPRDVLIQTIIIIGIPIVVLVVSKKKAKKPKTVKSIKTPLPVETKREEIVMVKCQQCEIEMGTYFCPSCGTVQDDK